MIVYLLNVCIELIVALQLPFFCNLKKKNNKIENSTRGLRNKLGSYGFL